MKPASIGFSYFNQRDLKNEATLKSTACHVNIKHRICMLLKKREQKEVKTMEPFELRLKNVSYKFWTDNNL